MKMRYPAALSLLTLAIVALAPATRAQQKSTPSCIKSWGEARARALGYDHVVVIENGCDKPAACVITTDVAPEPIQATVEPKQRVELTTFRNSPATAFKPKVECKVK
jgi:6-phosphofructokinase